MDDEDDQSIYQLRCICVSCVSIYHSMISFFFWRRDAFITRLRLGLRFRLGLRLRFRLRFSFSSV